MKKVLITNAVPPDVLESLRGIAEVIQGPSGGDLMSREDVLRLAPALDGIINQAELQADEALLQAAPRLQIVANVALGTDNLKLAAMAEQGVWATNTPGVFVDASADCTMGLILSVARRLGEADRYVRAGKWRGFQPGIWDGLQLNRATLGIVGFGKIGQAVAKRAEAFGMRVIFHKEHPVPDGRYRALDDLLREADVVSLHVPLTEKSRHLFGSEAFSRMKRGSFFINMARGPVVQEQALVDALSGGHLAGAGLDVFEEEPAVHPQLLRMENVVLTPHMGGGTTWSRSEARTLAAQNVAAVLSGGRPLTPVNEPVRR